MYKHIWQKLNIFHNKNSQHSKNKKEIFSTW